MLSLELYHLSKFDSNLFVKHQGKEEQCTASCSSKTDYLISNSPRHLNALLKKGSWQTDNKTNKITVPMHTKCMGYFLYPMQTKVFDSKTISRPNYELIAEASRVDARLLLYPAGVKLLTA